MGLAGRHIVHIQPFAFNADLFQQAASIDQALGCPFIAMSVVAIANGAGHDIDAIRPFLKCPQDVLDIYLASARKTEKLHVRRILQAHRSSSVGSHSAAIDAGEGCQFRPELLVSRCVLVSRFAHSLSPLHPGLYVTPGENPPRMAHSYPSRLESRPSPTGPR